MVVRLQLMQLQPTQKILNDYEFTQFENWRYTMA